MQITVIGTGYVGLVAGACFADVGNEVTCVDANPQKVELLRAGEIPIYEPGLQALVQRNAEEGRLSFVVEAAQAIQRAEIIFIAVGTPPGEDGSADLSYVLAVAREIATHMNNFKVIVCKSTVPVGTCDRVRDLVRSLTDVPFAVVSNPEFLKEGAALKDFQSPDRVVIGCDDLDAARKVGLLYKPFMRRSDRILYMDVRSAELTKYASNAMLATKISFMNEIANLADRVGADVELVRVGMSMDERIGSHFIFPGAGYGGSCFPKDVRALHRLAAQQGMDAPLLHAVEDVNNRQKLRLVDLAVSFFGEDLTGKKFAAWGLSFKPRTDDIREAPALIAIRELVARGATVMATDPVAIENAREELEALGDRVRFDEDNYAVAEGADALFVFTEWNEFRSPDLKRLSTIMRQPVIFDGRNIYDRAQLASHQFTYFCIGRNTPPR